MSIKKIILERVIPIIGLCLIPIYAYFLIFVAPKQRAKENAQKAAERYIQQSSARELITNSKTKIIDSLISEYEQSDSGKDIIDSLVDKDDIIKQEEERKQFEDNREQ